MAEKEKAEILEALNSLPEDKKQFMLGYAAGVTSKNVSGKTEHADKNEEET